STRARGHCKMPSISSSAASAISSTSTTISCRVGANRPHFPLALLRPLVYISHPAPLRRIHLSLRDGMIVYGLDLFRLPCSLALLGVALLSGCEDIGLPPEPPEERPVEIGQDFDAATAGTLRGQVTWEGAIPVVPSYRAPVSPGGEHAGDPRRQWPNPN